MTATTAISDTSVVSGSSCAEDSNEVNVVVLGKDGTGKTALIVRLLTKRFIHEYDPIAESVYSYTTSLEPGGDCLRLNVMDTAGARAPSLEEARWSDAFLLVASLTCRESLRTLEKLHRHLERHSDKTVSCKPIAIVATKQDLVQARCVSAHELQELAERWKCHIFETSATEEYENVLKPFIHIWREAKWWKERTNLFPSSTPEQLMLSQDGGKRVYKTRQMTK